VAQKINWSLATVDLNMPHISHGSAAACVPCGGVFNDVAGSLMMTVRNLPTASHGERISVSKWRSYTQQNLSKSVMYFQLTMIFAPLFVTFLAENGSISCLLLT